MSKFETDKFFLIGNNLALDFVNSTMFEATAENTAAWAIAVGLIDKKDAERLSGRWTRGQLDRVAVFRTRLREIIENLVDKRDLSNSDVSLINEVLRHGGRFSELQRTADGFAKRIEIDASEATNLLVPVTESFVDLLCYGDLDHLRQCENPDCILYFYDTTKNHRRRWCSMAACGNRAKAQKHYRKKKEMAA